MVLCRAPPPCPRSPGTPQAAPLARDPRCRLLHREERLPVAPAAPRLPSLEDDSSLLQDLAPRVGTWERIHAALRERLRVRMNRDPQPSAGVVDGQSVKST